MISILIVEDEAPIRELLRISLKEAGYECTCAGDGDEAADILNDRRNEVLYHSSWCLCTDSIFLIP